MLATLGFLMVLTFMVLIMTRRLSPLVALILVPLVFGWAAGGGNEMGQMMLDGVKSIAHTGVMLIFGIMYFGIMIDAGLFDPLVNKILKLVKSDPLKVVVGTAILALLVSLDGDGATTYIIVVTAMLPLYKRLNINPLKLTAVVMLSGGVMNILPWGGPTARVMTALNLDVSQIFVPMIGCMIAGAAWVITVAYILGLSERKKGPAKDSAHLNEFKLELDESIKRPKLLWINLLLTILLLGGMVSGLLPLPILFMIAFSIALMINYPKLTDQRERFYAHAGNALAVGGMIFAAGIFTGIMTGTKMLDAIAAVCIQMIPESVGPNLTLITAGLSVPFTFFISNDAFYYGILPILSETATHFQILPEEMGRASLMGQPVHLLSPLVPSTYILVGLAEVEFGDHLKYTFLWACGTTLVMTITAFFLGIIGFI